MYRGTALVVALTGAGVLAALGPVSSLLVPAGAGTSRLRFASLDPALDGLPIATPRLTPADAQAQTVEGLFGLLVANGAAVAGVGLVTLLLLWFARASARSGEIGVRRAAGASRKVLLAASLLEGLAVFLLAISAGAPAGLGFGALAGVDWPGTIAPGDLRAFGLVAAGLGLVLLVGAEFPALFTGQRRIVEVQARPVAFFFPALLQLGTCLIALTTGALLLRHLGNRPERTGAVPEGTLHSVHLPASSPEERSAAFASLLAASPGASLTSEGTHLGLATVARITTDCGACYVGTIYSRYLRPQAAHHFVSPDTFRLLGLQLVEGRLLTLEDDRNAAPVAVVSQSLANDYFEAGRPLGRGIQLGDDREAWYTVVGVVSDFAGQGFGTGQLPPEQVWVSVLQASPTRAELLVPPGGTAPVHEAVGSAEPFLDRLALERGPSAWFGRWLGVGAVLMLVLAALGVVAFARVWVLSLRPELGLLRAAGARRGQVVSLVLRQAAAVGLAGTVAGLWFGPAVWLAVPEFLPGLPAWDPWLLAGAGVVMVALMLAGALPPALRAAREAPAALLAGAEEA